MNVFYYAFPISLKNNFFLLSQKNNWMFSRNNRLFYLWHIWIKLLWFLMHGYSCFFSFKTHCWSKCIYYASESDNKEMYSLFSSKLKAFYEWQSHWWSWGWWYLWMWLHLKYSPCLEMVNEKENGWKERENWWFVCCNFAILWCVENCSVLLLHTLIFWFILLLS